MQLSQADAYFDLAVKVIGMAISASDLRSWWESERAHRKEYGLSDQQIDDLIHVCKEHVELLEDGKIDQPKPNIRRRARSRRALI